MQKLRLPKVIRRIVRLQAAPNGALDPVLIFKKRSKRKKQTGFLRPLEERARTLAQAQATSAEKYIERHDRSNRDRRDGWLLDAPRNLFLARRKGAKKLARLRQR